MPSATSTSLWRGGGIETELLDIETLTKESIPDGQASPTVKRVAEIVRGPGNCEGRLGHGPGGNTKISQKSLMWVAGYTGGRANPNILMFHPLIPRIRLPFTMIS